MLMVLPLREEDRGTGGAPAGASPEQPAQPAVPPSKVYGSSTGELISGPGAEAAPEGGEPPPTKEPQSASNGGEDLRFQHRLDRERKRWLREEYGTDDPNRVKAIKTEREKQAAEQKRVAEEHKRLKGEEEKRKREAMSKQERLEADLERERKRAQEYQQKVKDLEARQAYTEQNVIIEGIAQKHVDPDLLEDAMDRFARHVRTLDKKQLAALNDRAIDRWFAKLVVDKPKFGKPAEEKGEQAKADQAAVKVEPEAAKPAPQRRVVTTSRKPIGGKVGGKPVPPGPGKTAKPGQANSMSRAELAKEYKEKHGRPLPW